jgi:hypothetical protein
MYCPNYSLLKNEIDEVSSHTLYFPPAFINSLDDEKSSLLPVDGSMDDGIYSSSID